MAHPSGNVWLAGQVRNICAKFYGENEGVREEEEDRFASFGPKVFRSPGQRDGEGGLISVRPPPLFSALKGILQLLCFPQLIVNNFPLQGCYVCENEACIHCSYKKGPTPNAKKSGSSLNILLCVLYAPCNFEAVCFVLLPLRRPKEEEIV